MTIVFYLSLLSTACSQNTSEQEQAAATPVLSSADQLRLDIGEMLLVGFRGTVLKEDNHIVRDITQYHVGSVILFEYDAPTRTRHRNIQSKAQLKALCSDLQKYAGGNLLIGVDQEGGNVARLRTVDGFPATATAAASAQRGADSVRSNARVVATELREAGINLDFAPCVDVNVNPDCPVIGKMGRSFSADPEMVTKYAAIWCEELREQGVASCAKHFPGHGSSDGDTHAGLVDVSDTWKEYELLPYRNLVAEGKVDMVMVAHVICRPLGDTLPASLSPAVIREKLRGELGFDGVVVTDDLAMGAISRQYGFEEALRLAITAGCDMLCLSNNGSAYNPDLVPRAVEAIEQMVLTGQLSADDIHRSAERLRKLKKH